MEDRVSSRGFDALYRTHARRLVGQLLAITGDLQEAEDVVQEAFVRAWRRWPQLDGYDAPEAWVRRVAINLARNRFRRARRQLAALIRHGPPGDVPALTAEEVAVTEALRHLSRPQREALVLYHLIGLSVGEVAGELGVPVGTVKARLARGRRALAQQFEEPRALLQGVMHDG